MQMSSTEKAPKKRAKRKLSVEERREAPLWSPAFAASEIMKSAGYVYAQIDTGKLSAVRCNGFLRIRREDWQAWLSRNVRPFEPGEDS